MCPLQKNMLFPGPHSRKWPLLEHAGILQPWQRNASTHPGECSLQAHMAVPICSHLVTDNSPCVASDKRPSHHSASKWLQSSARNTDTIIPLDYISYHPKTLLGKSKRTCKMFNELVWNKPQSIATSVLFAVTQDKHNTAELHAFARSSLYGIPDWQAHCIDLQ